MAAAGKPGCGVSTAAGHWPAVCGLVPAAGATGGGGGWVVSASAMGPTAACATGNTGTGAIASTRPRGMDGCARPGPSPGTCMPGISTTGAPPHHRAHNCAKLWVLGHGCIFHSCIRQGLLRLGRHSQIYSAGRQSYRKIRCRAGCGFCPLWPIKPLKKMCVFRIFYGRRPPSCSHRLGQIIRVWRWGFRHRVGTQHGCIRVRCALVWMRGKARQKGAKGLDSHARGACNLRKVCIWALQRHP